MTRITTIPAVLAVLLIAGNAVADDLNVEITPFAGYRFGGTFDVEDSDESYSLVDSSSYGLILNLRQKQNTQWEILYSRQQTDARFSAADPSDPLVDVDTQVLQLGGTYQGDGDTVRPYVAATIGATHIKTQGAGSASDTFWSGSIGLGLQVQPNSRVGIRLEARGYGTLVRSDSTIFCGSGPEGGVCAVQIDGKLFVQIETLVGIVFRF